MKANSVSNDPFSRHRSKVETQPEPAVEAAPVNPTEAPTVEQPAKSKVVKAVEIEAVEPKPVESKPSAAARAGNLFGQHKSEPPARTEPERMRKLPPAAELLVWIRQRWNKPIISLRDIQTYAPRAVRDRMTATTYAETLEKHGWLAPVRSHRRDRQVWQTPPPAGATALPEE
jgi:hypothetical protein